MSSGLSAEALEYILRDVVDELERVAAEVRIRQVSGIATCNDEGRLDVMEGLLKTLVDGLRNAKDS